MKAPRLRERDRRALTLGALVLVPALLLTFVVQPYARALTRAREGVATQRGLLARELALLAESGQYPERLRLVEAGLRRASPRLFRAPDDLSATAALANYVGERAVHHRVLLRQVETKPAEPATDGLVTLRVDIQATGDLEGLLELLYALEEGPKLVWIDRLGVERASRFGGASDVGDEEVLTVAATVAGYAVMHQADKTRVVPDTARVASGARTADAGAPSGTPGARAEGVGAPVGTSDVQAGGAP